MLSADELKAWKASRGRCEICGRANIHEVLFTPKHGIWLCAECGPARAITKPKENGER